MLKNSQAPVKKANKALQVIPVIIIIVSIAGALYFSGYLAQETTIATSGTITPTRDIVGTWKTPMSTQFGIATDFSSATIADVGTENRTMTWVITATNDENIVNVHVTFAYSSRLLLPDSGYTPDVSPMDLRGVINGTQLTLTRADAGPIHQVGSVGVLTFTTSNMEGTWHDHWSGVYEQNVYTQNSGLKLIKQ